MAFGAADRLAGRPATDDAQPAARGLAAAVALAVAGACVFGAVLGYALGRHLDGSDGIQSRAALRAAAADIRRTGLDPSTLDPLRTERLGGLDDLQFESADLPTGSIHPATDREMAPVLDPRGRIVGWFNWRQPVAAEHRTLWLGALPAGIVVLLLAGVAIGRARRLARARPAAPSNGMGGEPALDGLSPEDRMIVDDLLKAMEDEAGAGGLDVHYQPVVSADGAHIVGAEALLRWTHPRQGEIPPDRFVALAERSGLMGRLGAFVLRRALSDAARWPGLSIAVNLSPAQVRDPALVDAVAALLAEYGVAPSRLVLEVTEGMLIEDPEEARARLDALAALGVRLALDDFGTGYSSLTYLQQFRFEKLKIDRGFVAPLGQGTEAAESRALMAAIVALGRALGLTLLAEGVETEEQRVLLRLAGCQEMQGFLFGRPAPREILDRLIAEAAHGPQRPGLRAAAA